ncbi:16S rRNA (guanine(527)-N(7))-methyltransferase RsmG [Leptothermofonsia sp. ETS-13]|uniref:16S rRNA (guanine(527)-N(7))-methyltransferase RsmG n=1 Tax=Leptothermofonsia sp. ETS-13 TaxID=3035696 RepID=UPI003B9F4D38
MTPHTPHLARLPDLAEVWQTTMDWRPIAEQQTKFQQLYGQILEGNRLLNLTRITDPQEFWEKHLWDSLRGIRRFLQPPGKDGENFTFNSLNSIRAIDIGTGAGFPGVPIAIVKPSWQVMLMDSTRKKIQFLNQLLSTLELSNATTLVERAESVAHQPNQREVYDLALIRAVAIAPACAEYALPLLKVGGLAVLYRGQWTAEETVALEPVIKTLGGQLEAVEAFKTPLTGSDRHCLYLRKIAPTPNRFPRAVGVPVQKPLKS